MKVTVGIERIVTYWSERSDLGLSTSAAPPQKMFPDPGENSSLQDRRPQTIEGICSLQHWFLWIDVNSL